MARWIDITPADDLPPGSKACHAGVLVANVDGRLYAMENTCPHAGMPLADGDLSGRVIICRYHGYAYRIDTGRNIDYHDDPPVRTLPVRVADGTVQVDVESRERRTSQESRES